MTESRRMVSRPRMRADQTIAAGKCRPKIADAQAGCCKHNPASRVGLTPSPTCHTGQGGSRKGMRPLRQRNGSHENVSPPLENRRRVFYLEWRHLRARGIYVPTCQPVQIAELAKSET